MLEGADKKRYTAGYDEGYKHGINGHLRVWVLWFNKYFMDQDGNTRDLNDPYVSGYHCGFNNGAFDSISEL